MPRKTSKPGLAWENTSKQYEQVKNTQTKIMNEMGFNKPGKTRIGSLANTKMQIK